MRAPLKHKAQTASAPAIASHLASRRWHLGKNAAAAVIISITDQNVSDFRIHHQLKMIQRKKINF